MAVSKVRNFIGGVLTLTALLCAGCALIGLFAQVRNAFDFPNQITPFWMATGVLSAAGGAILSPRMRRVTLVAGALTITIGCARTIPELLAGHAGLASGPASGPVLKIVSLNLWKRNCDPSGTAAWILAQDPDVVVLADAAENGEYVAAALSARYPYSVRCSPRHCSTLLLSKQPSLSSGGLARGDPENRKGLSAAWATFADSVGPYTVIAVHMPRPWPFGSQELQRRDLAEAVSQMDKRRLVVAGDFNETPWSAGLGRVDAGLGLPRLTHGMFTWPARLPSGAAAWFPVLPIDQIYAGSDWRVLALQRGPRLGSDHYPLSIQLAGPAGGPSGTAQSTPAPHRSAESGTN